MNNDTLLPDIRLRAMELEDLDLLYTIENDMTMWDVCTSNVPYSKAALTEFITRNTSDIYADRQLRLIVENGVGQPVGIVDILNYEPRFERAEVGVVILKEHRHHGYAAAALRQVVQYAINVIHLHQLYAIVAIDNHSSMTLFKNEGFMPSAELKDWIRTGNDFKNAVVMQLFLEKVG